MKSLPLLLFALGTLSALATGQDPAALSLQRVQSGEFSPGNYGPIRWLDDGSGYTTLEQAQGGGRDIVRHDPATGTREVLVAASSLVPKGRRRPLPIADYAWSSDGKKLVIFTNTRRVWRHHTRGDYWVLDRTSGVLQRLGTTFPEATLMFAKLSPDATRASYVQAHDLWVEDLATKKVTRLTTGGSSTLSNGTFDWVYEEEWGLRDGFRWSPDGTRIAYWQIDAKDVGTWTLTNLTGGLYPELKRFPYPKVGTQNPACRIGVVPAAGGKTRWLNLPGDLRDDYVAWMDWASADEVVVQRVNRLQNHNRILAVSPNTGAVRTIVEDRDDAWLEVEDLRWIDGGDTLLFLSERDGWRHLWTVPHGGGTPRVVTPGDYDVLTLLQVDERSKQILFIASPDNPTQRYLYTAPLSGGGPARRLTPKDQPGTHGYEVSTDSKFAIHRHSRFGDPGHISLVRLPDHKVVRTLVTNDDVRKRVNAMATGRQEFLRLPGADGTPLDAWMICPPDLDEKKRYPLLVHVYGEPAGQTVLDRYGAGYWLWHTRLAQRGYVVLSIDNRGTPGPRGRAFRKSVYRKIGIVAPKDQAAAVRAALDRFPFLDRDRVGIWGWSGGGSMSLNAIFRYPDLYKAAIAIAFIANQRFYDTIYQERYMGLPDDNAEGFRDGSPITHAHRLKGDLLVVYGTGDDNCHYQNMEALVDELVRHGKDFRMMAYPNRSHGIYEGPGTRRHLFSMMERFLAEKLPTGAR